MVKIPNMSICVKLIIRTLTKMQTSPYEKIVLTYNFQEKSNVFIWNMCEYVSAMSKSTS